MIGAVAFSGGKDSLATILHLKDQGVRHKTIFCDTGWESPITLDYIGEMDRLLHLELETLRSEEFPGGFEQLCIERKMVPGLHYRFCTKELKVVPMWRWIESQPDEVTIYQGIRADESDERSKMQAKEWVDAATGYWIERPIFNWTTSEVFALIKRHNVPVNPLYLRGFSRVGCQPCVFANHKDLRQWAIHFPDVRRKVEALEARLNAENPGAPRAFFRANYLPEKYRTSVQKPDGEVVQVVTAASAFDYVTELDRNQLKLFEEEPARCMSVYNLCE